MKWAGLYSIIAMTSPRRDRSRESHGGGQLLPWGKWLMRHRWEHPVPLYVHLCAGPGAEAVGQRFLMDRGGPCSPPRPENDPGKGDVPPPLARVSLALGKKITAQLFRQKPQQKAPPPRVGWGSV